MEQEKELLQNQTTWLNAELKTKSEGLLSLSKEKGNEILELKCNLENKKDEVPSICCMISMGLPVFSDFETGDLRDTPDCFL